MAHIASFHVRGKTKVILVFPRVYLIQEIGHKNVRRALGTKHRQ